MFDVAQFIALADRYAEAEGVGEVTVSSRVFNDGKKITSLKHGADLTLRRAAAALQWFSDHWPPDVEWPEGVDRPPPSPPHISGEGA
jgi:hypothetical protein